MLSEKTGLAALIIFAVLAFNFIPTAIAALRRHPDLRTIASINIASLISFLLWGALFIWAIGGGRNSAIDRALANPTNRRNAAALLAVLFLGGVGITALQVIRA